jgi:RHS repeat-associated protein
MSEPTAVTQTYNLEVLADTTAPVIELLRSTNIADIGETISFQVNATDNVGIKSKQLLVNNQAVALDSNGVGIYQVTSLGVVTATAIATDVNGNSSNANTTVNVIDPTDVEAPTVKLDLSSITNGIITGRTDIKGTVTDNNLDYYALEVARLGTDDFKEVFRGTGVVTSSVLGKFDPSLLENDSYRVRLSAFDKGGQISSIEDEINVAGDLKLGNFRLSFTDLTIPVTGIPISLTRTYDSLTVGTTDDFGYGWRMEFRDTDLRTSLKPDLTYKELGYRTFGFQDGDRVYITLPGGKREGFTFQAKPLSSSFNAVLGGRFYYPSFVADKGSTSTLTVPGAEYKDSSATNQFASGGSGNANNVLIRAANGKLVNGNNRLYRPEDDGFGNRYLLTSKDGTKYEINATTGDLETVTDTNGNVLTYSDNAIVSSTGVQVTFERDNQGRITSVTNPLGQKVVYGYDAKGDLVSVTDRDENTTQFQYNATRSHYLDKIVDPLGRAAVKTEYDESGRLKKTANASGNGVEFVYNPLNSLETVKDALGNATTYEYDSRGNVVTEVDALGGIKKRTYDDDNHVLSQSDAEGNTTTYTYDRSNNLTSVTDSLGNTTTFTFNRFGEITSQINALGNVTNYSYDDRGNRLLLTNTLGSTIGYTFDAKGNPTTLIDASGNVTQFQYDSHGNLSSTVDALGHETTHTYDASGNQLSQTTTVTTADGVHTLTQSWTYDANNHVTAMTDAAGNVSRMEYDVLGKQTAVIDFLGRRTEYIYDDQGKLIKTKYADGTTTSSVYDAKGQEIATTDASGNTTNFIYDALGRLIKTIYPDLTPNDLTDNPTTKTEYDKAGRVIARTDEKGNRTQFTYDADGRQTVIQDALGHKTSYTYNAVGKKLTETDALNNTTQYIYDAIGHPIGTKFADGTTTSNTFNAVGLRSASTDQAGRTTHYEYDAFNRVTAIIDPLGNRTTESYDEAGRLISRTDANDHKTTYQYDDLGRRVAMQDALGNQTTFAYDANGNQLSQTDALGHTTQTVYDSLGRPIEIDFADGTHTSTAYDALGQKIASTDQMGIVTHYEYDPLGRLTAVVDANQGRTTYGYDLAGNLISQTDANNHTTNFEYNALNQRTATILPLGQRSTTVYDAVGKVASTTDANGHTISYQYDTVNHLTTEKFSDGSNVSYTYTSTGKLATVTDASGVTTYTYDRDDRLLSRTDPDGQKIQYTYDSVGNRTSVIIPASTTTYTYDAVNRLSTVTDGNNGVTHYTYDADGNLVKTELPNSTVETRSYDLLNRLVDLKNTNPTGLISSYHYTLDAIGERTKVAESSGLQVRYTYDNLHRLTQEVGDSTLNYTYDAAGNRLTKNDSVNGLTTYNYNSNDRLLSETLNGQTTIYTYDNNGNTLSKVKNANDQTVYKWDDQNRLIGSDVTDAIGTHHTVSRYNSDSIRVAEIVDGQETRYLVDANRPYAQVLAEYTPSGTVNTAYVYGHDLISQNRGGVQSFYEKDGLGSTTALTNSSGDVINTYAYDAFGNSIGSTGSTVNNYLYAGEQYDSNLREYYLRARYYDAAIGRFTRNDSFEGFQDNPISLHKYLYANGNPVNGRDPSGFSDTSLAEVNTTVAVSGELLTLEGASVAGATTVALPVAVSAEVPVAVNVGHAAISIGGRIAVDVARATMALLVVTVDTIEATVIAGFPVLLWGSELPETTLHTFESIIGTSNGFKDGHGRAAPFLGYTDPQPNRMWLDKIIPLPVPKGPSGEDQIRDEYPYNATVPGGPDFYNRHEVSIRLVPDNEQRGRRSQAAIFSSFYSAKNGPGIVRNHQRLMWYGVFVTPTTSFFVDRLGIPRSFPWT